MDFGFISKRTPREQVEGILDRIKHNLHINGCETTVGDGTADGTGQCESRVEGQAAELLGGVDLDVDDGG